MPNLPTAVGAGVSVYVCNPDVSPSQTTMAETMLKNVGAAIKSGDAAQIHAMTGIFGSGPAYVFAMVEVMTHAGIILPFESTDGRQ